MQVCGLYMSSSFSSTESAAHVAALVPRRGPLPAPQHACRHSRREPNGAARDGVGAKRWKTIELDNRRPGQLSSILPVHIGQSLSTYVNFGQNRSRFERHSSQRQFPSSSTVFSPFRCGPISGGLIWLSPTDCVFRLVF